LKEVVIEIPIIKVHAKKNLMESFTQNPGAYIVKMCNMRAIKVRVIIDEREEDSNIRYYGDTAMIIGDDMISKSMNELIREIDAIEEEKRYFAEKFLGKEDLINMRVKVNIPDLKKTASVMKYYYRIKYYRERDKLIKKMKGIVEYLRYSEKET
jgi:hypothetical protein